MNVSENAKKLLQNKLEREKQERERAANEASKEAADKKYQADKKAADFAARLSPEMIELRRRQGFPEIETMTRVTTPSLEEAILGPVEKPSLADDIQKTVVGPPTPKNINTNQSLVSDVPGPSGVTTLPTNTQAAPNVVVKPVTNTAIPSITPESALATGLTDITAQKGRIETAKTNLDTESGKVQQNYDELLSLYGDREAYSNKLTEIKKQQDKHEKDVNDTQKEVSDISNKIGQWSEDPNRFFRNLGTGQKISLAIAGIASMVGAAFSGAAGKSPSTGFVDIIMKNIDNDIAAQRSDLSKMKESRAAKESLLGIMQGRYDDTVKAETLAKVSQIEAAKLKIEQAKAKATSEQAKSNYDMAIAELDNRKNDIVQRYFANKNMQFSQNMAQAQLGLEAEKLGATLQPKQIYGDEAALLIQTKVPEKLQAKAFEELGFVSEYKQGRAGVEKALTEMSDIGGISGNMPFTQNKAAAEAGEASILATLQGLWKGPMSDKETALARQLIPVPSDTPAQATVKKRMMLDFLDRNKKPTPTVDHFGILGNKSGSATINATPRK
jgi:hypothetical protein